MNHVSISKSLLVFGALCAACAPAWSQSSVTLSGLVDIGVYRDADKKWNVGPIQRSNVAFSGTESLGSGLSAFFNLSTRFDPDTGTLEDGGRKPFWHGESTVGIKGGFGSIKFGRALDALYANDWNFDPWYYFDRIASPAWDLWHYNFPSDPRANNGAAEYGRLDNGIFYDSPVMGGFSLHVSGSPERRDGDARRSIGSALKYAGGPVLAMVSHEKNSSGATDTFFGLKGTIGALSLMGAYDISKTANATSEAKATTLGVQYSVGSWTLNGGWGQVDVDGVKAEKLTGAGAIYALSKRTSVYADVAHKSFVARNATVYGTGLAHSF